MVGEEMVTEASVIDQSLLTRPWFSIWRHPRATIQRIVDTNPKRLVLLWAAIGGLVGTLNRASGRSTGDTLELPVILLIAVVAGPIFGILSLFVSGALLRWTGRWIGGAASQEQIRAAIAWGLVPFLWVSLMWIPELLFFGKEMFTTETPRMNAAPTLAFVLLGMVIVEFVGVVWTFVVHLKCLGQVQGFSAWRALGNLLLAGVVLVVPLLLIVFTFVALADA
jgi:hypothetical protein